MKVIAVEKNKNKKFVKIKNVSKSFGDNLVLDGINIDIYQGEILVIVGPSGSGKSTLTKCINGLEDIDGGYIIVDDVDIHKSKNSLIEARSEIGMVFQHFNLFPHLTILDNITLAPMKVKKIPKNEAIKIAMELLKKVNISEKVDHYPNEISGGQQQRVAIARALAMKPKMILFDEPTSALDPETIGDVLDVMRNLVKENYTIVCVTHEMGFAKEMADRIIFMDGGKVVEENNPKDFFENPQNERTKLFLEQLFRH